MLALFGRNGEVFEPGGVNCCPNIGDSAVNAATLTGRSGEKRLLSVS